MKNFNYRFSVKRMATLLILTQAVSFVSAAVSEYPDEIMNSIRGNRYIAESQRLQKLARQLLAGGDYDQAVKYASDAAKAAAVSDVYVRQQVKIYVVNNKINDALQKLAQADLAQAKNYFPAEFYNAKTYYNLGLIARNARKWDDAISNADKVIETLAAVDTLPRGNATPPAPQNAAASVVPEAPPASRNEPAVSEAAVSTPVVNTPAVSTPVVNTPETAVPAAAVENKTIAEDDDETALPARYTVRSWEEYGDCFWNIAGRSWVYGDPRRWPILYQANKNKIPDPKNPDLIEQGMIMEIPSINGEKRLGAWDSEKTYTPR
jgi:tetratricopeptide (TPR) repeat protein